MRVPGSETSLHHCPSFHRKGRRRHRLPVTASVSPRLSDDDPRHSRSNSQPTYSFPIKSIKSRCFSNFEISKLRNSFFNKLIKYRHSSILLYQSQVRLQLTFLAPAPGLNTFRLFCFAFTWHRRHTFSMSLHIGISTIFIQY